MLTKLSQQQLEVIRGKYLEQNKSLAQQNSALMMKCNSLEDKISQLLKENTAFKNEQLMSDTNFNNKMAELESYVDSKFSEVLEHIRNLKHEVPGRKQLEKKEKKQKSSPLDDMIPEVEEELEIPPKQVANPDVVAKRTVVEPFSGADINNANSSTPITSPVKTSPPSQLEIKKSSNRNKRNSGLFDDLTAKMEANKMGDQLAPLPVEPKVEEIQNENETSSRVMKSVSPELIITEARSKRRRKSDLNYKWPSLRAKMRRNSEKMLDAVYDDDDLIVVDKRRDSLGRVEPELLADKRVKPTIVKIEKAPVPETDKENVEVEQMPKKVVTQKLETKRKAPLSDITSQQNVSKQSTENSKPYSIFDFIEEDNVERKTIFSKSRRNSII